MAPSLEKDKHDKVKKVIPYCLGFLSCLYGSYHGVDGIQRCSCKLFLNIKDERQIETFDYLLEGFWCSKCDSSALHKDEPNSRVMLPLEPNSLGSSHSFDFAHLYSLYIHLLFDESSEEVQLACVAAIRRVVLHGPQDALFKMRTEWVKCIDFLLLNRKKSIREAFCTQISSFLQDPVLSFLFSDGNGSSKSSEENFLDMIKNALAATEDPQIIETLLESTAEIMMAVDVYSKLFLFSLILLVDQLDNLYLTVRLNASRLIHKSCCFHFNGGFELLLSKAVYIRNELFDYLSIRLASRPKMVKEFAEAVLGVETKELLNKMIPVVLPKLVVSQQDNNQAVDTLYELAKCLNTDVVPLIVNWLPKVLAFALHQADEKELFSAVQFYHAQIGSNNQEIFAAALPALLDELICFLDGGDLNEINSR
ncbi:hypothetical protein V6Z12_A12G040100 [Gossypium hirsutum]